MCNLTFNLRCLRNAGVSLAMESEFGISSSDLPAKASPFVLTFIRNRP